jgi:alkylhydroperoxidase family enzyme
MARIEPLPSKDWPPEMRDAFAAMTPPNPRHPPLANEGRPRSRASIGTFAHHPDLARAFLTFSGHILMSTSLAERHRELLVMRVATVRRNQYEWAQHVFLARDAGLTDEEIARIAFGANAPFWTDLEAALLRAVDELIADGVITETTWNTLAGELDHQQLLDVIFTVGAYETLAFMTRSLELDDRHDDNIRELTLAYQPAPRPTPGT